MCGIAGAFDLTGTREFPADRLLAMTGAIAHRGPDDEHVHHRARRRPGGPAALDRRPRRRPPADRQRGRLDLGRLQRRAVRVPRAPPGAARPRPPAGHPVRHRGVGPPLRGPRRGRCSRRRRGQFAVSLWDRPDRTPDPRPRPRRHLPALLRRARRLAALGLGDQGPARLGPGPGAARPEGDRPPLLVLLRRHLADVLRGGHVAPARATSSGSRTAGSSDAPYWDLDFPDAGDERRLDDPTPLVDELEHLLRQAVERRLRGDVPVVSYISGGLDSTVVLGLSSPAAGQAVPSFTIGLDNAGPGRADPGDRVGRGPRARR